MIRYIYVLPSLDAPSSEGHRRVVDKPCFPYPCRNRKKRRTGKLLEMHKIGVTRLLLDSLKSISETFFDRVKITLHTNDIQDIAAPDGT